MSWSTLFPFAIWSFWKHRNRVCFDNTPSNLSLHNSCINQALEYFYYVWKIRKQNHLVTISVRWMKPPMDWLKLNTNGASLGNPGKAGGGGVIRDSSGKWVKGFSRSIGVATSVMAECWAIRDRLTLAKPARNPKFRSQT